MNSIPPVRIPLSGIVLVIGSVLGAAVVGEDTFPALVDRDAPANYGELWQGFDPRAEPLMTEVLTQWEDEGVVFQVVRFRVGEFLGEPAMLAGVYGYPKQAVENGERVPGLLQIHGGGQYADHKACLMNARGPLHCSMTQ